MVGDERDGHDQEIAPALLGEPDDGAMQRWREPLRGAHLALVADMAPAAPSAVLPYQIGRSLNLALVRVTLLDYGDGKAVGTEDEVCLGGICEAGQRSVDGGHDRLQIERVLVELLHHVDARVEVV